MRSSSGEAAAGALARLPLDLVRAAALLSACAGAVLGLAAWGGAVSVHLDALTHLAPFGLAAALGSALLWLASGRGRTRSTGLLCAIAVLAWGLLMAPEFAARLFQRPSPRAAETIRIVQFNTWGDRSSPQVRLAWIAAQNPDVIVFEEIAGLPDPVLEGLAERYPYKMTCESRPHPCEVVILARRPALAEGKFSAPVYGQANTTWARFAGAGGDYVVAGVHLGWPTPDGAQQAQTRTLVRQMAGFERKSLILAGDFNATPWSFSLRRLDSRLGLQRRTRALATWPAGKFTRLAAPAPFPLLPIDHVYAGSAWRTVKVERGPDLGSDHYPVAVTLTR